MGLDVYLYRCPNIVAARASEAEFEKLSHDISERLRKEMFGNTDWKAFDGIEQGRKDEFWKLYREQCAPIRKQCGIKEDGYGHVSDEQIEMPSTIHPEHYFKIGYFRSSYNDGGFNAYARRLGVPTLNEIFDNEEGEYEFQPNWLASRERALAALNKLRAEDIGYDAMCVDGNMFLPRTINSEREALQKFKEQLAQQHSFDSYDNADGSYFMKGLTIMAALPGNTDGIGSQRRPCTYLIVKRDEDNWYEQALEVVVETCDYVLAQPNRETLYFHWSG